MPTTGQLAQSLFITGEPQEEAFARLDYLKSRGGGWCELTGPHGIGKSSLLSELHRLAHRQGHPCGWLDPDPCNQTAWTTQVASSWNLHVPADAADSRRVLQDHLLGWAALNRPAWLLIDAETSDLGNLSGACRRLSQLAQRCGACVMIVMANPAVSEAPHAAVEADLRLELWPWDMAGCQQYLDAWRQTIQSEFVFSPEACAALLERSQGFPGDVARIVEWSRLAAGAEGLTEIDGALIHAVADEFSARPPRRSTYEVSAAYGAW